MTRDVKIAVGDRTYRMRLRPGWVYYEGAPRGSIVDHVERTIDVGTGSELELLAANIAHAMCEVFADYLKEKCIPIVSDPHWAPERPARPSNTRATS